MTVNIHTALTERIQHYLDRLIQELEEEVRTLRAGEVPSAELQAAEERGYRRAFDEMQESIRDAVKALGGARTEIWKIFYERPKGDS